MKGTNDHGQAALHRPIAAALSWCLPALLLLANAAGAQDAPAEERPNLLRQAGVTGSVRAGYWTSTRELDSHDHLGTGMVWLKSTRPVNDHISFLAEGWATLKGPAGDTGSAEIREAFVDVRVGRLDVRLGRQIIAWGRADGINPTDNLTGEDLTLLAPEDDDRRRGTTGARASFYLGDVAISGAWLPEFRGHRFPLPAPPPDVTMRTNSPEWPGDQWAVRVERTGRAVDWSVSYFRGLDLTPDVGVQPLDRRSGDRSMLLVHRRVRVFGADMAANAGRFGLRAEGAYVDTEDASGMDRYIKNPFVFLVIGTDRTFREHLNLNVQYLYRVVIDHQSLPENSSEFGDAVAVLQGVLSGQTNRVQHGMSFRIARTWLRETLEAECAAAGYVDPGGLNVRLRITYLVSDHLKVLAGAEIFRGDSLSTFALLRPNSAAYLEARWSF